MHILVTGAAGYIATHTIIELLAAGHSVVGIDNFCNSSPKALARTERITGQKIPFRRVDIRDREALDALLAQDPVDACIHFAGLKSVGESAAKPWEYYDNNIGGTLVLVDCLKRAGCRNIIFSSSATVYGEPAAMPITEETPKGVCTNPYGWSKWMIEQILADLHAADVRAGAEKPWNVVLLRYFNPVGAHASGLIGEDPRGIPNNLMPYITQVAVGKRDKLHVFGDDYPTVDGTGVRDFIHVVDLAKGHVAALKALERNCGVAVYNLGTGRGCSVLQLVRAFEKANGVTVPYVVDARRPGDVAECWADASKAARELGWKAERGLADMCRDAWNWQSKNPNGYGEGEAER